jgi:uncharacterized protein (DUF3820 family)
MTIPSRQTYDRSVQLLGTDPMPFGKWRGKELRLMPQWYFKWFVTQNFREYWPALRDYAQKRLGLAELPVLVDNRPKGPAQPPTEWITGEEYQRVDSSEPPF